MDEKTNRNVEAAIEIRDRVCEPFSIGRGTEEGSWQGGHIAGLDDPQELRALELEALGYHRDATRIRACGAEPFPKQMCKIRLCPSCATDRATALYRKALSAMRRMSARTLCLVTVVSTDLLDLRETIDVFRSSFTALRRRRCFRTVRGAVGMIEPKLSADRRRWSVHAHPVLDVAIPDLDVALNDTTWQALVERKGRAGSFSLNDDRPNVDDGSIHAVARYVTKSTDVAPSPGTMSLRHLDILRSNLRGVRLPILWGVRARRSAA